MLWPRMPLRPRKSFTGRFRWPAVLISFGLAGAFLLFLVTRFDIDLGATWQSFQASNPLLFVLALLVHYTTFLFRGARWRLLLNSARQGGDSSEPNTPHCGSLILLGWFTNSVTWFRLGDAYRAHVYAQDSGGSFSRTIGTILAERVLDIALVFLLLALATLLLVTSGVGASWIFMALAALMVAGLAGVLLIMWVFRLHLARYPQPGPGRAGLVFRRRVRGQRGFGLIIKPGDGSVSSVTGIQ